MQTILLKVIYFERGLSKSLEKGNFIFFQTQSLSIDKIIKNKKNYWWNKVTFKANSGYKTSSENSFISYVLSDQVWWCNTKQFLSYSRIYICKFMQVNLLHHMLFHFHLSFWVWEVWKGRGKITKIWTSWERKELFRLSKKHFS